mmetsp:Transcript_2842/g.4308  ORF Transcript_2842/g.4308 Transcript_2842/m.4308 type:complete len:537 (-) Transcript_2842:230-1840(-)
MRVYTRGVKFLIVSLILSAEGEEGEGRAGEMEKRAEEFRENWRRKPHSTHSTHGHKSPPWFEEERISHPNPPDRPTPPPPDPSVSNTTHLDHSPPLEREGDSGLGSRVKGRATRGRLDDDESVLDDQRSSVIAPSPSVIMENLDIGAHTSKNHSTKRLQALRERLEERLARVGATHLDRSQPNTPKQTNRYGSPTTNQPKTPQQEWISVEPMDPSTPPRAQSPGISNPGTPLWRSKRDGYSRNQGNRGIPSGDARGSSQREKEEFDAEVTKVLSRLVELGEAYNIDIDSAIQKSLNRMPGFRHRFEVGGLRKYPESERQAGSTGYEPIRGGSPYGDSGLEHRLDRLSRFMEVFSEAVATRIGQLSDRLPPSHGGQDSHWRPGDFRSARDFRRFPSDSRGYLQGDPRGFGYPGDYRRLPGLSGDIRRFREDSRDPRGFSRWEETPEILRDAGGEYPSPPPIRGGYPLMRGYGPGVKGDQPAGHPSQWELPMSEMQQNPFSPSLLRAMFPGPWWLWGVAGALGCYVMFDLGMALTFHA